MSVCLCATIVCAAAAAASVVLASESESGAAGRGPAADRTRIAERTLPSPVLSQRATARLAEGIRVGHERLRKHASCRALFERLGDDGAATLDRASYHPASPEQERKHCRRGVFALTTVGASAVVLCRGFARLSPQQAAIILIHEALHLAGQEEAPAAPGAPDSLAITGSVMAGCRLL
jgi:hypothetical protein